MPNENATPRNACGSAKNRLKNGYAIAIASATTESSTVSQLVTRIVSTKPASAKTAPTTSASHGAMSPRASGRSAVRFTCASNLRSAQSLNAQPAERITIVPTVNTRIRRKPGCPSSAIHSAASVGQSSSRMPIGLSSRTSRSYASSRSTSVRRGGAGGDVTIVADSGESAGSLTARAGAASSTPGVRPSREALRASRTRGARAARASSGD